MQSARRFDRLRAGENRRARDVSGGLMAAMTHGPLLVVGALSCLAVCAAAAPDDVPWEVRLAQLTDQKDEWTQMGRVPGWDVTIGPGDSPTIEIGGDEDGAFRGIVLVGRKWRVPRRLPAAAHISLKYQTYCAMNDAARPRAGNASLAILTPERWEQFATDPKLAEKWRPRADDDGVLALLTIHRSLQDVTEWRDWRSANLRSALRPFAGREVVLALVWWAAHFCEEWAKFADVEVETMTEAELERESLEALDLERPELAEVKAALERDDLPTAKAALVAHMRSREKPVGPGLSPDGSQRGIQAADEIVDHVFRLVGCPPTKLEADIRWNEDPHNYDQWAIALNRHSHWVTLGRAYAATGDERYAREFVAQLNSWIDAMPAYIGPRWIQGPFFEEGRSPLTLDAGIRMGQTWWPAYYYFKDSPSFDVDSQVRMLRSFRHHAIYLMEPAYFKPASNWGAMEVNGLFHIAVMLPEFREAGAWLATARERLTAAQQAQVYPDGAQIELSPGYHGVTLGNLLGALELARRNGVDLPEEFEAGLESMFECYMAISMPDGRTPALNDSGWGSVRNWLARGHELFPERADFEYIATGGRRGPPPEKTSWLLPNAGWVMMRSGWKGDDNYLHFDAGPFGAGHQHEDKLSIIVHAGRKTILTEGGNYAYDTSDWRRYVLSTRAHNTVMADGLGQSRRRHRETFVVWEPEQRRWITNDDFDYAEGTYAGGYGPDGETRITHARQIVFMKPDYWIVIDTMTPADEGEHEYEALFHLDAEEALVESANRSVTAEHDGGGFRIIPLRAGEFDVRIVKGEIEPTVQGWLPTGKHNVLRPIPTAVFRWRASGRSVMAYALVPGDSDGRWPVTEARLLAASAEKGITAEISLADGCTDLVVWGDAKGVAGPVDTDAEVAVVRVDAAGRVTKTLQIGGSRVGLR